MASTLCALALALTACGGDDESAEKVPATTVSAAEAAAAKEKTQAVKQQAREAKQSGDYIGNVEVAEKGGKQVLVVADRDAAKKLCAHLKSQGMKQFDGASTATIDPKKGANVRCKLS